MRLERQQLMKASDALELTRLLNILGHRTVDAHAHYRSTMAHPQATELRHNQVHVSTTCALCKISRSVSMRWGLGGTLHQMWLRTHGHKGLAADTVYLPGTEGHGRVMRGIYACAGR